MGAFIREDDFSHTMEQVFSLFPVLKEKRKQPAANCRAVNANKLQWAGPDDRAAGLDDEPTAGVSPIVMDELFDRIIEIARTGIAILMVEQNAKQVNIADKGYVLVQGRNRYTDTGEALLADPDVRRVSGG